MKRIKSFLTIIMATIFALSLVPAGALATDTNPNKDNGELYTDTPYDGTNAAGQGSIQIKNAKKGETYGVYRIFDLASFNDQDRREGQHGASTDYANGEAYSYVIREYEGAANSTDANKWWTFLTTHNKDGAKKTDASAAATPYMVDSQTYKALVNAGNTDALAYVYFVYEKEPIALTDTDGARKADFHAVKATESFSNAWDVTKTESGTALSNTFEYDKQDYADPSGKTSIKVVQDFAQDALAYAKKNAITADYTETATGDTVTVNSSGSNNPAENKVYLGWYLMGTATGTLASLDTTNKNVVLYDKNEVPSLKKKVLKKNAATVNATTDAKHLVADDLEAYNVAKNATNKTYGDWAVDTTADKDELDWVDNTDADVNDLVQFRAVVDARQGASRYVLHDVMEPGLKLLHQTYAAESPYTKTAAADNNASEIANASTDRYAGGVTDYDLKVYLVRGSAVTEIPAVTTIGSEYYINWTPKWDNSGDGCDFEIAFLDATADPYAGTGTDAFGDADNKVAFVTESSGSKVETDVKDGDKIVVTYLAKVLPEATVWGQESEAAVNDMSQVMYNDIANGALKDNADSTKDSQVHKTSDGDSRNTNSAVLTYGAKSHTDWVKSNVTVYQLDIAKTQAGETTGGKTSYNLLNGAQFRMYKALTGSAAPAGAITSGNNLNPAIGDTGFTVGGTTFWQASKAMLFTRADNFTTTGANVANPAPKTLVSYRYQGDNPTGASDNTQTARATANGGSANVLESVYNQEISVHGLEEGWYLLVEEEAPEGFNKLAHPIAVYVNGDMDASNNLDYDGVAVANEGKLNVRTTLNSGENEAPDYTPWDATVNDPASGTASATNPAVYPKNAKEAVGSQGDPGYADPVANAGVHVINNTGQELPSTGGIGTTIFYVAGTVLVVGAVVMLVAKRRMGSEA